VVPSGDGRLTGYSTDGAGFVSSLMAEGVELAGRRVCVLGGGAAARAIIDAVARCGAAEVSVVNRSADRARTAAGLAGAIGHVGAPDDVARCDVVVNATSLGMGTTDLPCDSGLLRADHVVVDIVYHPRRTALLAAAEQAGAQTVGGLGMLVHQAVLQQQLWTGVAPEATVMWAAAERELASRGQ
jgi:shikimate dehydrogenase